MGLPDFNTGAQSAQLTLRFGREAGIPIPWVTDADTVLTECIIACAIDVHKALGLGLLEPLYAEAMAVDPEFRHILIERRKPIRPVYRGRELGCDLKLDLIVANRVVHGYEST